MALLDWRQDLAECCSNRISYLGEKQCSCFVDAIQLLLCDPTLCVFEASCEMDIPFDGSSRLRPAKTPVFTSMDPIFG